MRDNSELIRSPFKDLRHPEKTGNSRVPPPFVVFNDAMQRRVIAKQLCRPRHNDDVDLCVTKMLFQNLNERQGENGISYEGRLYDENAFITSVHGRGLQTYEFPNDLSVSTADASTAIDPDGFESSILPSQHGVA